MTDVKTPVSANLRKLGTQWVEYANNPNNGIAAKGKTRERLAHAFAAGAYLAGMIGDGAMFVVSMRGSSELERWAKEK